jgi:hypothetical protein
MDLQAIDAAFSFFPGRQARDEATEANGRLFAAELTSAIADRRREAAAASPKGEPFPPDRSERGRSEEALAKPRPAAPEQSNRAMRHHGHRNRDERATEAADSSDDSTPVEVVDGGEDPACEDTVSVTEPAPEAGSETTAVSTPE